MDENFQELDYRELELSVRQEDLEIIDQVLLADLARSWERLGKIAPPVRRSLEGWSSKPEVLRSTPLGKSLLIIAAFVHGKALLFSGDLKQAMELVCRQLFGDSLGVGYMFPQEFHKTKLGQLFEEAKINEYDFGELMEPEQAYHYVGVTRQSLHDRAREGKLHRFYRGGRFLYVRTEIKGWKAQREQRRNRSKS